MVAIITLACVFLSTPISSPAETPRQSRKPISSPKYSPFSATCKIAELLATDHSLVNDPPKPLPHKMRAEITGIVQEIAWPDLGNSKFWEVNKTLQTLANRIEKYYPVLDKKSKPWYYYGAGFDASLSLVLTAWDLHLKRNQLACTSMFLRCYQPDAVLVFGHTYQKNHEDGMTTVAKSWPWTNEKGKLILQPTIIVPVAQNGGGPMYSVLQGWNTDKDTRAGKIWQSWTPTTNGNINPSLALAR